MAWNIPSVDRLGRQLTNEARRDRQYPLLLLPSTEPAFRLIEACEEKGVPCRVVGNPSMVKCWHPTVAPNVQTPRTLWHSIKAQATLPCAVAVFQDQLVAIDDSYRRVTVDSQNYLVSPIEVMILMKFRPRTYLGTALPKRRCRSAGIALARYQAALPPTMTQKAVDAVMGDVLRPLLACADDQSIDWHARPSFALKQNNNFNRLLVQQLQEMESLIRLYAQNHPGPPTPARWIDILRAGRLEIAHQVP